MQYNYNPCHCFSLLQFRISFFICVCVSVCVDRLQRISKDGAMKCSCKSAFSVKGGENMKKTTIWIEVHCILYFYSENVYCVKRVTALSAARLSKPSVWKKTRSPEERLAALAGGLPFKIYLERLDSHNNRALRAYEAVFFFLLLYRRFSLVLRSSVALSPRLSRVRIDLIAVVRHKPPIRKQQLSAQMDLTVAALHLLINSEIIIHARALCRLCQCAVCSAETFLFIHLLKGEKKGLSWREVAAINSHKWFDWRASWNATGYPQRVEFLGLCRGQRQQDTNWARAVGLITALVKK